MTNRKIQLNLASVLALSVTAVILFAFQAWRLMETQNKLGYMRADTELALGRAQVRLEKCVDMAADNRDEALMS